MVLLRLNGKVALITGGGTGIGEAIADLFSQEGANVVVTGRRKQPLEAITEKILHQGGQATYYTGDVSNWDDAQAMVKHAAKHFGPIDVLVTCAGVIRRTEKVEEVTEEQWNELVDINLKGTFSIIHFTLPFMMERRLGNIITISSTLAHFAAAGYATYCATKGGVSALTKVIALQYAPYNIRANSICPGMVKTPMAYIDRPKPFDEIVDGIIEQQYPLKRVAMPKDIAKAALFLASEESSYITGHELVVDGGFSIK